MLDYAITATVCLHLLVPQLGQVLLSCGHYLAIEKFVQPGCGSFEAAFILNPLTNITQIEVKLLQPCILHTIILILKADQLELENKERSKEDQRHY